MNAQNPVAADLIEAALEWAEAGIPVFPTGEDKRPLTRNGFYDASTDPDTIEAMFKDVGARLHGIGGRMGAASGIFAIDADTYKPGEAGDAAKAYMAGLKRSGMLPSTRVHATRNGGRHYLFRAEEFPNCKPSKGVEVKGEGGYIILPPSPGYTVESRGLSEAPAKLVEGLKAARSAQSATALDVLKANVLSGDDFHDSLTQIAAKLSSAGEPLEAVQATLLGLMNASIAANPQHPRHNRWQPIMADKGGELTRIVASGHAKYNVAAKTDGLREAATDAIKQMAATMFPAVRMETAQLPVTSILSKRRAGEFRFLAVSEMELREPQFLIADLLEENALIEIFGEPGAGKSLLAYDMAACIATGHSFHGHKVRDGAVLILAGEGHNGIKRRLSAWEKQTGRSLEGAPLLVSEQPAQLLDQESLLATHAAFEAVIVEYGKPSLVIVDTLARNFGPGDENSNRDMSAFVAVLDDIRSQYGCSVVVVHHSGHSDSGRGRGASALKGAVDAEFGVKRDGGQRPVLFCTKMKDAPKPPDAVFDIEVVEIGWTSDGQVLTAPVLVKSNALPLSTARKPLTQHMNWVMTAFRALLEAGDLQPVSGLTREQLRRKCIELSPETKADTMRQRFNRSLQKLIEASIIIESGGNLTLSPEFLRPDETAFSAVKLKRAS
jgi:hypothetical protein